MIEFKNGFYADVRTEDRSRAVISYTDGILQEMKTSVERRAFLRVYDGKMWYYASVTDLAHLQKTLDGITAGMAIMVNGPQLASAGAAPVPATKTINYNQTINVTSPDPVSPAETARATRIATRDLISKIKG